MTHKQKRKFFDWLQKHGALKAYKRARHRRKILPPFESYEEMSISNPLGWAFYWRGTSEGYDFWNKLDIKWRYYLQSLKHK
jgi:hypothetical protein